MKQTLTTVWGETDAAELVRRLAAADVVAEWIPQTDEIGTTPDVFQIVVAEEDYDRALLLLTDHVPEPAEHPEGSGASLTATEERILSVVPCPRCDGRRVALVNETEGCRFWLFLLMSVPLLGLPAAVWFYRERRYGSQKLCLACRHSWRSRP